MWEVYSLPINPLIKKKKKETTERKPTAQPNLSHLYVFSAWTSTAKSESQLSNYYQCALTIKGNVHTVQPQSRSHSPPENLQSGSFSHYYEAL